MLASLALSAALLALFGAGHCAAMCGGFVAASFASAWCPPSRHRPPWRAAVVLHAGRLVSYALAGALAGAIGGTPALLFGGGRIHTFLFSMAALVLVATGLNIAGIPVLPGAGAVGLDRLRRKATALVASLSATDSEPRRLALGFLWGWAPCAIVYSALPLALVSGSALSGALVMMAFGAGTLPALLGAGWLIGRGMAGAPGHAARRIAGALIVILALAGLLQVLGMADTALGRFCLAPAP